MTRQVMIIDASTGTEIVRDMTAEELQQREAEETAYIKQKAVEQKEAADKVSARDAIYTKLGLTADEIAALTN